jgi:hypothetical protein
MSFAHISKNLICLDQAPMLQKNVVLSCETFLLHEKKRNTGLIFIYAQLLHPQIPKGQKLQSSHHIFIMLLGSVYVKAAHKMLVKSTHCHQISHGSSQNKTI